MMSEETLPKVFIDQVKKKGDQTFLIYKQDGRWRKVSWNEVGERVKYLTVGLMALGVAKGDRITPISQTRPELAYCCLAIANAGAIFAPIYHTNNPKECAYVLSDSGAKVAFAENEEQLDKLKQVWSEVPALERIVVFEKSKPEADPRIMSVDQLRELGKRELSKNGDQVYYERIASVEPDDVTAIIYTSGTTGPPKGVMETNGGLIRFMKWFSKIVPVSERDRGISYLPMAHLLELLNGHWFHIYIGFPQVYAESMERLFDNIQETRPTLNFTTPRFFEKKYNQIWGKVQHSPKWKKKIVLWCLRAGAKFQDIKENSKRDFIYLFYLFLHSIAHLLFLRHVRKTIGKHFRFHNTGGAPIADKIMNFFRACGMPIYESYGLTEAQGQIGITRPGAYKIGTVGKPVEGIEIRFTEENEILVRGWLGCKGYWNNPQATDELFRDGWLHTGDTGFLDEEGFLHITGRKKDILITSSGKNISPSKIENLLKASRYISEAVAVGHGKEYIAALVILNQEEVINYAQDNKITFDDFQHLVKKQEIVNLIDEEIKAKNRELARVEQVRKFTILEKDLRPGDEEVTPTLKVKRRIFEQKYKDQIDAMYKKE